MLGAWFLVISGIATLLIAANRRKMEHVCRAISIQIRGNEQQGYISKEEILRIVERTAPHSLINQPVASVNLQQLEKTLKQNPWILNAELYFDSRDALHVMVSERMPVARIFTTAGVSFYMDSSGHRMPLLAGKSLRLPVITGYNNGGIITSKDSAQLKEVKKLACFLFGNEFWNAQIGQVDITAEGRFELIPVIGDHIIKLGSTDLLEEKFDRLLVFYKQVMAKTGFNKYATLDIEFDRQVIGVQKGHVSEVDSMQLQKNIEVLMNRANLQNVESEMLPQPTLNSNYSTDSLVKQPNHSVSVKTTSVPGERTIRAMGSTSSQPPTKLPTENKKQPKAVMKKRIQPDR